MFAIFLYCIGLVERGVKGDRAQLELERKVLPIRERRILRALESMEERNEHGPQVGVLHRELRSVRTGIRRRRAG